MLLRIGKFGELVTAKAALLPTLGTVIKGKLNTAPLTFMSMICTHFHNANLPAVGLRTLSIHSFMLISAGYCQEWLITHTAQVLHPRRHQVLSAVPLSPHLHSQFYFTSLWPPTPLVPDPIIPSPPLSSPPCSTPFSWLPGPLVFRSHPLHLHGFPTHYSLPLTKLTGLNTKIH